MSDAAGRLVTLVAYDEDGLPRPLLVNADGYLLCASQAGSAGGSLKSPSGKLFTPVANDPDDLPRPIKVDADGYLKVALKGGRVLIHDETLTVDGTFTVQPIPPTYDNLRILLVGRSNHAATSDTVLCYFNGDGTHANYTYAAHWSGTGHGGATGNLPALGSIPAATGLVNSGGFIKADIPSYHVTTYLKMARSWAGDYRWAANIYMMDFYFVWVSTVAISSLVFIPYLGNKFLAGSRLQVWGIF
jgi:hypothetical protein